MLHSLSKMFVAVAMIAIIIPAASVSAESPSGDSAPSNDGQIVQVGHAECVDGCSDDGCLGGCVSGGCGIVDGYCEKCRRLGLIGRIRLFGLFGNRCDCDGCRNCRGGNGMGGNFLPNGCGGKGCPPFGRYQMVYPLNPDHCDPRDGQVHAAQGYGMPMAVPLAPVVRHQYNYSWGVPASRITHISNHAPHRVPAAGGYGPSAYDMYGTYGYGSHGHVHGGVHGGGSYCPECQANGN